MVPNRVHLAVHMTNYAEDNLISVRFTHCLGERAKGGCGLVTAEEMGGPTGHPYDKLVDAFEPEVVPGFNNWPGPSIIMRPRCNRFKFYARGS